ncbi:MAG: DUF3304 domain-containing protein [Neisseriaceae bacterium]|nr:DUF3304 domain-containing protein [Neisseriaceae bacterium]
MQANNVVLTLVTSLALSGCAGSSSFMGNDTHTYTPIEGLNYQHAAILSFNVNGGCGPNTSSISIDKVGKMRWGGGSQCGGMMLPRQWTPDLTVRVSWKLDPYPRWKARRMPVGGVVLNPQDRALKQATYEQHSAVVPVPKYGDGVPVCAITVHFLACEQVYVDLGCGELNEQAAIKADFARFKESQKLCKARPVINTIDDYYRVFGKK